jgi:outer membrane protein OmpA-like peptidoglycan-associated protein
MSEKIAMKPYLQLPDVAKTAALAAILATACTSATNRSPELYDAQRAYQRAEASRAGALAPDRLLTAEQTLERAQRAEPGSDEERQLSYLATRRARIAEVYAEWLNDKNELARAKARAEAEARRQHSQAKKQLDRTQGELAAQRRQTAAMNSTLRERERQLGALESDLERANTERADAEKRAQTALASLKQVALVQAEASETVITLSGAVLFVTGRSELLPIAQEKLDRVAEALKETDRDQQVVIEGHTDSRGVRSKNMLLSLERARAVRDYLAAHGVDTKRMNAVGVGPDRPVANNSTAEGRADNRRVEIHVLEVENQKP